MTASLNTLIIIGILSFILFFLFMKLTQAKKASFQPINEKTNAYRTEYTVQALVEYISTKMLELTTSNLFQENLKEEEFNRRLSRRKELKNALKTCNTGDTSSRIYVKEFIYDLLKNDKQIKEETIEFAIPFSTPEKMTYDQKFESILFLAKKNEGIDALGNIIKKFKLNQPKNDGGYRVLKKEIDEIYKRNVKNNELSYSDKLGILTQLVYSKYKGFGVIDEIREMNIDGVSGGVSGMPENVINLKSHDKEFYDFIESDGPSTSLESIWVMYQGKSIHLSFLSFETGAELRRIVTNAYKFGYPGQLSETRPAIINEMADGSRVTVVRPKLSESWAFFIRKKYDVSKVDLPELITQKNATLVIMLLSLLMKSKRTVAVTGSQGSGKTTLLIALIGQIAPYLNLRVLETKFELNLRKRYPWFNILSLQETDTYTGQEALDLSKKMDGDVTILGEVATNPVASWMIQSAQVASLFTMFTHHAKTLTELVHSLRNALLSQGLFQNEKIAEQQVVKVLEFDVHLRQDQLTGERYIERITECIPAFYLKNKDYKTEFESLKSEAEIQAFHLKIETMYYMQQVQTTQFIENTILEYRDGEYVTVNRISNERLKEMIFELNDEEREQLRYLMEDVWGE